MHPPADFLYSGPALNHSRSHHGHQGSDTEIDREWIQPGMGGNKQYHGMGCSCTTLVAVLTDRTFWHFPEEAIESYAISLCMKGMKNLDGCHGMCSL